VKIVYNILNTYLLIKFTHKDMKEKQNGTEQMMLEHGLEENVNFGKKGLGSDDLKKQPHNNLSMSNVDKSERSVANSVDKPILLQQQGCQTYFCYEQKGGGKLEIDLVTFREKGVETRYLSMLFSGFDVRQESQSRQSAFLNIETKEEFERLKSFFAQVNWDD